MSKGYTVKPWKPIEGTGQALTVPNGSTVTSAAVGANTYAIWLSVITGNCLVRISHPGTAASASTDMLIKTTDPGVWVGVMPGDKVSAWGLAAGTLYMCEGT